MGELKRLKSNASASTAELREFVRGLRGRSPQEVMGIVSASALTKSLVTATFATVVLLGALTVIPYAFSGPPKPKTSKPTAQETAKPEADSAKSAAAGDIPSEDNLKRASKAMGLDETKTADPNKNPLDNFDNLLDKVK
jgi:hypothetical protein